MMSCGRPVEIYTSTPFFFDIDGTLVSFKTHKIPQSTVDALEQAKKNGVEVYISTGRPKQIINNLGQIEHLIAQSIYIRDEDTAIYSQSLAEDFINLVGIMMNGKTTSLSSRRQV